MALPSRDHPSRSDKREPAAWRWILVPGLEPSHSVVGKDCLLLRVRVVVVEYCAYCERGSQLRMMTCQPQQIPSLILFFPSNILTATSYLTTHVLVDSMLSLGGSSDSFLLKHSMHLRWSDLLCLHHWCQVDWFKLPKTIEIFSLQLLLFSTPYHLFSALLNFSLHRDSQLFYLPYPTPTGVRSYSAVTDFWSLQIADFWSLQIITLAALVLWLLSLTVRLRFR